jgi:hypothetical protein
MTSKKKDFNPLSYPLDNNMTVPHRVAHCLNWAAEYHPFYPLTYMVLYQAIMGLAQPPRKDNKEVELIKSRNQAVKKILHERYKKGLVIIPGMGVRATVDDADRFKNCAKRAVKRVESAALGAHRELSSVDAKNIENTPDNQEAINFLSKEKKLTLGSINELLKKTLLLTGKKSEKVEEKKEG